LRRDWFFLPLGGGADADAVAVAGVVAPVLGSVVCGVWLRSGGLAVPFSLPCFAADGMFVVELELLPLQ